MQFDDAKYAKYARPHVLLLRIMRKNVNYAKYVRRFFFFDPGGLVGR